MVMHEQKIQEKGLLGEEFYEFDDADDLNSLSDAKFIDKNILEICNFDREKLLVSAKLEYKKIQTRQQEFCSPYFRDGGWAILLDLFIAKLENKNISVSSACIASGFPATTALRWMADMCENNVLIRKVDKNDKRKVNLEITDSTLIKICAILL